MAPVDELPYRGDDAPVASRLDGLRWLGWPVPRWAAGCGRPGWMHWEASPFFFRSENINTAVEKEKSREVGEVFGRNKNSLKLLELWTI